MTIEEILSKAKDAGIELFLSGGNLRAKGAKGKISPEIKELVRNHKTLLIEYLSSQSNADIVKKADREDAIRFVPWLSYAQQRLWFVDQLGGGSVQYNIPGRFYLRNGLNVDAFKHALKSLIDRHEVLRTCFQTHNGQLRQVIVNQYELPFTQYDISEMDNDEKQKEALRLIEEEGATPFDLCHDLMLRVRAIKLSDSDNLILYTQHHIASDGWSMSILKNELRLLYSAYCDGKENPLEPLKIQYADYALWQRDWLQGEVLEKQIDYWHSQLAGIPNVHNLPLDKPRPQEQSFNANRYRQVLDTQFTSQIEVLCEKNGVSLFILLQTVFAIVLSRYSNEKDIVIGTPIAGRTHKDVENLIGFFVNSLVLRTDLSNNPTFLELLHTSKETILDAYSNQHVPFEMLVEQIRPERNLSYNPIFQILFVVQNNNKGSLGDEQVQSTDKTEQDNEDKNALKSLGRTRFDLELHVHETDETIALGWVYNAALFNENDINNISNSFKVLLEDIIVSSLLPEDMQPGIEEISLLTNKQQKELLVDWNNIQSENFRNSCIHQLIETQAQKFPNNPAIIFGDKQLTFKELNEQANQLAHYLIERGVKTGAFVALCIEKSIDMIIGLLGILKAGCAYVPLDPNYPSERLNYILEDSNVNVVIGHINTLAGLDLNDRVTLVLDDREVNTTLSGYKKTDLAVESLRLKPSHLAYVIYTSGSTGKPKGVMVSHQNVANYLHHGEQYLESQIIGSVVSTTLVFDATVCSLYIPLCSGKYVELLEDDNSMIDSLMDYMVDDSDSLLFKLTPSHLKAILNSELLEPNNLANHVLVVGGEQLTQSTSTAWKNCFPQSTIINEYGPTEATVGCSVYYDSPIDFSNVPLDGCRVSSSSDIVPIGKPINNVQMYVLNEHFVLQPVGVVGELYIGGSGITDGYINQAGLTAEKFIPDPFSETVGRRIYRTGDLVRWLHSGELEFIERLDDQVKIRGYRIELGEIESVISNDDNISDSVVKAYFDSDSNAQLIAYLCPSTEYLEQAELAYNQDDVSQWTKVFDDTYSDSTITHEIERNYAGWDSSYTMEPIPTEQMEEWLYETMKVIGGLKPKRLLEIGCGTGLLLFKYAEYCKAIRAVDISSSALSSVKQGLNNRDWKHVELSQGDALSISNFPLEDKFDSVIINSVVQYFPNLSYLERVLEEVMLRLKDGGHILLGDIRNLDLLEAHATAVERSRLTESTQVSVISSRVQRRIQQEQELLISPTFFYKLSERLTNIGRVDILVKRGLGDNEMARYRYEVLLTKSEETNRKAYQGDLEWHEFSGVEALNDMLVAQEYSRFGISGIPNWKVMDDVTLNNGLRKWQPTRLIHPEEVPGCLVGKTVEQIQWLQSLLVKAEEQGYQCGVTWSQQHLEHVDIIFSLGELPPVQARETYSRSYLANYPQLISVGGKLSRELRSNLENILPPYLVPDLYIVMEHLPLTLNGKIDNNALPVPQEADLQKEKYVAATTDTEERMCLIWQEILQLDKIGIHDNFFSLGGHSLLATRLISSIRKEFGTEVQLRMLFESPTVSSLSERISTIVNEFVLPPIEVVDREQKLALSYAQQRLWFIDQLGEGSTEYNMQGRYQLHDTFNETAFKRAIASLIERHEVLRTHYATGSGETQQVIAQEYELPYIFYDLTELRHEDLEREARRLIEEDANACFDLSQDLMLRASAFKLSHHHHLILYTIHHIAGDAWSIEIFKDELHKLYQAYCDEKGSPLEPIKIQYVDYAQWQRNWLQGDVLSEQLNYWKSQLSDIPPVHSLPLDKSRPSKQTHTGKAYIQEINRDTTKQIKAMCEEHGVTLFMFLHTAFTILLSRYSNQSDIVIGTPTSGRTHSDVENLIGFFVNTLVLRTDTGGNPTFSELLTKNKKVVLDAYAHQHIPFEMLVDEILQERDLSYNALFQILFDVQKKEEHAIDTSAPRVELSGGELKFISKIGVRFDLALHVKETKEILSIRWSYRDSLFEDESIRRMAANYGELLDQVIEELKPLSIELGIENLKLLNERDRNTLLFDWNKTLVKYPTNRCIHELFEEQVLKTPDNVAVIYEDKVMTYRALNDRSNCLAQYLIEQGVKPDTLIVVCFERSFELMISLLGVLKAGAAYVPMDPNYPESRLEYMLNDCGASIVITQAKFKGKLFKQQQAICLDDVGFKQTLSEYSTNNINAAGIELTGENLAYVIYTSGSTGKPKGVMINHSSVCNFLNAIERSLLSEKISGSVVSSPIAFDATVQSLYLPLCVGKYVELLPENDQLIPNLTDYLIDDEESLLFKITPTHLKAVSNQGFDLDNSSGQHVIVVAGELLTEETLKPWQEKYLPKAKFINEYGPTEATVGSCIYSITKGETFGNRNFGVPIGKPLNNVEFYVLDKHLYLQPIGSPGELYIGGAGLARGYLNQPELTRARFITNPFSDEPHDRLYKTGDLVRWTNDGNIEFLGRVDDQVKIRGFRIELGEIESVLLLHDTMQDVVVVAREDKSEDEHLVAYIVCQEGQATMSSDDKKEFIDELKRYLGNFLPSFMVPQVIIIMDELPLTPNGKVDKTSLPTPCENHLNKRLYTAPRNETEDTLCRLWQDILKLEKVGIHDNFFTLGGHSLSATRLISLVREEFSVELPLRKLFECPTVASLSGNIQVSSVDFVLPPIGSVDREGALPLSYAQERLWFIDQLGQGSLQYNMPGRYALQGDFNSEAFKQALKTLLERHEILRTKYCTVEGQPRQVIQESYDLPFTWQDLSTLNEQEKWLKVERLIKQEAVTPFNLSEHLMFRVKGIKLANDLHLVLYTLHHIASDGWSMGILQNELSALYACYSNQKPDPLEPIEVHYADYAIWQRKWLQGTILEQQLSYWNKQLADIPSVHSFPLDKPRPATQTFNGMLSRQVLNVELTRKIKAMCEKHEVTLFMFLQTTFALLLSEYNSDKHIVMGTPIAGRTHKDVEGLIGFFVNSLVLKTNFSDSLTFDELLAANKQMILEAYAHQHIPFEMLVEEINPKRNLSFNPLFQILFSLQNNEQGTLDLQQNQSVDHDQDKSAKASFIARPCTTRFDIEVRVLESNEELSVTWVYNHDLFEDVSFSRLSKNYAVLLSNIVDSSINEIGNRLTVDQLERISEQEKRTQLFDWNDTEQSYPENKCLHELFELLVKDDSQNIALIQGDCRVTYFELNELANQLVADLIKQGVGAGNTVGIFVDYSIEMVVAMIAILKSGGAYTLLDTSYSTLKLAYLIENTGLTFVVTQPSLQSVLVSTKTLGVKSEFICVLIPDMMTNNLAVSSDLPLNNATLAISKNAKVFASSPATVIYSNGLHGQLRKVVISHENITSLAATSTVADSNSQLQQIIANTNECIVDKISYEIWSRLVKGLSLTINEISTVSQPIDGATKTPLRITNGQKYVLRERRLAPIGAPGELYVSGDCLSQGYVNDARLTAERFVPHMYSNKPGRRLYRTGLAARYQYNGAIEISDNLYQTARDLSDQERVIEVERILSQHEDVDAVCVLQRENISDTVCCVVSANNTRGPLDNDDEKLILELRQSLRTQTSIYPLPVTFIRLASLAKTETGELDRAAMLVLAEERFKCKEYVAPRNPTEEVLCRLWQDSLGVDSVSIYDNFFELGGHSLMATRLVSLIRQELNSELQISVLFEYPTVVELSANLAKCQDDFLLPPIEKVERHQKLPLSFAQQRLWFIDQLGEGSAEYNIRGRFHLNHLFNRKAFIKALGDLIERHEVLRTNFQAIEGEVQQNVMENYQLPLTEHDLSHFNDEDKAHLVRQHIQEESGLLFNLSQDLMLRVRLLKLSENENVILYTTHHIASDGVSQAIFQNEFRSLYNAYCSGKPNPLTPLRMQYIDYAVWQREWLQGEMLTKQLLYWKDQLKGAPELHSLPLDKPRLNKATFDGRFITCPIDEPMTQRIKDVCDAQNVTLFMFLQTAFAYLLGRYSNESDIVIASPIAGRNHTDIEELLGFFVNTLILRTDLSRASSFTELLKQNKSVILDAYAHQHIPFEMLVDELSTVRHLSHNPLVQISFMLQNQEKGEFDLSRERKIREDGSIEDRKGTPSNKVSIRFELEVTVREIDGKFLLSWGFNESLFLPETITRMSENYKILLSSIVNDLLSNDINGGSLESLELLEAQEKETLLHQWNNTEKLTSTTQCIHESFEEIAEIYPNVVALIQNGKQLSYSELNQRSNQLAHYLIKQGIQPEDCVGICVERSLEMVIALLGILKAGGCYLALDPEYPTARLEFMIKNSHCSLILIERNMKSELSFLSLTKTLPIDREIHDNLLCQFSSENVCRHNIGLSLDNLAYIIYTSGSTGTPKCVGVSHRNWANLAHAHGERFRTDRCGRALQFSSLSFDAAAFEIAGTLTVGATLCLLSHSGYKSPDHVADTVNNNKLTYAVLPPTVLTYLDPLHFPVKTLLVAGEAVSPEVADLWSQGRDFYNAYGPTETTVCATAGIYKPGELSIGKPLVNERCYVLDNLGRLAATGVVGELYVGGEQVTRGYLGQQKLTAEKFIPDPFSKNIGERLYRTGDLVRYLPDGRIEFIGRVDNQVKLRGFRIELGEIEQRLLELQNVLEVAVVLAEGENGEKRLVAYVVLDNIEYESSVEDESTLIQQREAVILGYKDSLQARLPEYMVPQVYMFMEKLPLTVNGKLDYKGLPDPGELDWFNAQYEPPTNPTESSLCQIWQDLLNLEQVGINDDFFSLGGHSLLATRLNNLIRDEFSTELPLRVLFESSTIRKLAKHIFLGQSEKQLLENDNELSKSDKDIEEGVL